VLVRSQPNLSRIEHLGLLRIDKTSLGVLKKLLDLITQEHAALSNQRNLQKREAVEWA